MIRNEELNMYEICLYDGEVGERLPEWQVVHWNIVKPDMKQGTVLFRSYDMIQGEELCKTFLESLEVTQ
jgi:hypothetical protein